MIVREISELEFIDPHLSLQRVGAKGRHPIPFLLFFYKVYKRGGVSFPFINIARGTTDPEIDSETWTKLGNNMAPLALIANLATRWGHLTFSHLITFSH